MTTPMTTPKTASRQQFVDAFSALQNLDYGTKLHAYERQYEAIIDMLIIDCIPENEIFNFISELLDPDYGIGNQVLEPYAEEQRTFCGLLRAGNRQDPRTIMPNIMALVEALNGDESSAEFSTLSETDINIIVTIRNVAIAFYSQGEASEIQDRKVIVKPACEAVQSLLSTHYAEGGEAAMQSVLGSIADRWASRRL